MLRKIVMKSSVLEWSV